MSVQKDPAEHGSDQIEVALPGDDASEAARRSAEARRTLIARFAPDQLQLIAVVRRELRTRLPSAHEVVYEYRDFFVISYSPSELGYEGALALRVSANAVMLYFNHGTDLPDPEKLLRGSGKQTRWVALVGSSTIARPAVARLIDEAISRTRVPFPRTGCGSLVFRSGPSSSRCESPAPGPVEPGSPTGHSPDPPESDSPGLP